MQYPEANVTSLEGLTDKTAGQLQCEVSRMLDELAFAHLLRREVGAEPARSVLCDRERAPVNVEHLDTEPPRQPV